MQNAINTVENYEYMMRCEPAVCAGGSVVTNSSRDTDVLNALSDVPVMVPK